MKFCKDCWNFSRCNAEGRTVEFAVDDGVCCEFDEVKNMTNADRIRSMDDELLATQLTQVFHEGVVALAKVPVPEKLLDEIRAQILKKLQQPAEGE